MNFDDLEKKKKDFFNKCERDLELIRTELEVYLKTKDLQNVGLYTYKYTMCEEMYDLFKCSGNGSYCGLGYFIRLYETKENPLQDIFDDYIEKFTEPKLMTSNKLLKLLDKVGV